jgi:hypothetical protein
MPEQQGGKDDKDLGLDWLAAQLNADGSAVTDAPDDEAASDSAADARADSAPTVALPVTPAVVPPTASPAAPPAVPPVASPAASPAGVTERTDPERPAAPAPSSGSAPSVGDTAPVAAEPAPPASGGFRWGLTPSTESDPAVDAARRTPPTPAAAPAAAAPVAPVIPAAAPPVVPAAPAPARPAAARPVPTPAAAPPAPSAASAPVADTEPVQPLTKTPAPPRRSPADLEAAPWWTTPAQSRLVPTEEEESAALGRRTPAAPPRPLDTGVAPHIAAAGSAGAAPEPHRASHTAAPVPDQAPTALPVSAQAAAAATGAVAPAPATAAHAAPAPSVDEPGPRRRGSADGTPPRRPTKRTLLWAGGAVLIVLVMIGLFFLGQSLGGTPVAAPTESASAEPSATPTPTTEPEPAATGPQPAGVHAWNTLFGTECLEPYTSPWDEEFTVVDCATPHTGQLVHRGILEGDSGSPFPGEQAFADQINVLCSAPGVIDFEAAGAYEDVQLQGSYPVTAEQWDAGDRYFYCFASRSSGEPLTTSLSPAA